MKEEEKKGINGLRRGPVDTKYKLTKFECFLAFGYAFIEVGERGAFPLPTQYASTPSPPTRQINSVSVSLEADHRQHELF